MIGAQQYQNNFCHFRLQRNKDMINQDVSFGFNNFKSKTSTIFNISIIDIDTFISANAAELINNILTICAMDSNSIKINFNRILRTQVYRFTISYFLSTSNVPEVSFSPPAIALTVNGDIRKQIQLALDRDLRFLKPSSPMG